MANLPECPNYFPSSAPSQGQGKKGEAASSTVDSSTAQQEPPPMGWRAVPPGKQPIRKAGLSEWVREHTGGSERTRELTGGSERARELTGGPERARELTGGPERARELTGGPERARELTGGPERARELTGGPERARELTGGPERARELTGGPERARELTGGPERARELTGGPERARELTGGPERARELTGGPERARELTGGPERARELTGGPERARELTGGPERARELTGGPERARELTGGPERARELTGGPERARELTGGPERARELTGGPERARELTGGPERARELTGGPERARELTGGPERARELTGGPERARELTGGPERARELTGGPERARELTGGPERARELTGGPERARELTGGPERARELTGGPERARELTGGPERARELTGGPERARELTGGPERARELTGGPERARELTGGPERARELTGGPERARELTGGPERARELTGGPERARELTGGPERARELTGGPERAREHTGGSERTREHTGGSEWAREHTGPSDQCLALSERHPNARVGGECAQLPGCCEECPPGREPEASRGVAPVLTVPPPPERLLGDRHRGPQRDTPTPTSHMAGATQASGDPATSPARGLFRSEGSIRSCWRHRYPRRLYCVALVGKEAELSVWVFADCRSPISSCISESMKDLSYRRGPQTSAHQDRPAHPPTIFLCKSNISQAALGPQAHKLFLEKAYNAAICFKMLRDLNGSDPVRLKYIVKKVQSMAYKAPSLVLETIHDYFADNPEISDRHKFRLFHILETIIGASDSLEETWVQAFMRLALENMTKSTPVSFGRWSLGFIRSVMVAFLISHFRGLPGALAAGAASNVLVAICRHSWRAGAQHLEAEVLTGVFPHRSLLYVMGVLTSKQELFNQEEKVCWEEWLTKVAFKSAQFLKVDVWSKELLWVLTRPDRTLQEQAPEKAFLFVFYGLILQAEDDSTRVRTHLGTLLGTSHQWPKQREGIALTVGLTAVRHLEHVWAALEQFGRSSPIKCSLHSFSPKSSEDLRWKWASSTILLAYGQMAVKAKAHILPWVDNILSRMIFFFRYSSWVLMEKEPKDTLCTSTRQQTIHIISSLCKLRPPLNLEKKSRLLTVCLRSVLALPLLDVLEKHTCLFLEPPNIQVRPPPLPGAPAAHRAWCHLAVSRPTQNLYNQTAEALDQMMQTFITQNPTAEELHFLLSHLYVWLASEKAHERQRAVKSCMSLLRFLSNNLYLDPKEDFKRLGQLVGMLGILCQDPDQATQHSSLEGLGHLHQLLVHQRVWSSGDQKAAPPAPRAVVFPKDQLFQLSSHQVTKEVMQLLTQAELTDLIWTAVEGLGSTSPFRVQAAASLLLTAVQEHGAQLETVANLGQAIHLQLCSVRIPQAKEDALQAITLLARNHTPELVAAFLDFSVTLDSMSLEALKSLLFTTGHCQDFARLELQDAWDLFTTLDTYPQGVGLLARAMVQSPCRQIKAVTSQLLPSLQSREERARKVAILILNEFLYSPALLEVLPEPDALMVLAQSIRDPSPAVRVLSLQGLGNILFHPEKGKAGWGLGRAGVGLSPHGRQGACPPGSPSRASMPSSAAGYTTCYHTRALSQAVSDADLKLLLCTFENLKKDREPSVRVFATSQSRFLQELAAGRQ
ncbi:PREDICTED: maestro heat-like repeat family member 5 [Myotis brandtii]|uniref:maestro heat-like repeat family member 5 n=1 Tax=Myotis brandtii TaxID=109478 RepID=UPI0003BB8CC2|nr:PREDICTED: maestro heat-like repeat family member 5 [Myotis brandtii]